MVHVRSFRTTRPHAVMAVFLALALLITMWPHYLASATEAEMLAEEGFVEIPNMRLNFNGSLENTGESGSEAVAMTSGEASYGEGVVPGLQAIHLNSANYTQLDTADALIDYSSSFSFAFWIKMNERVGGDPVLMGNKNWGSGAAQGWSLNAHSSGIRVNFSADGATRGDPVIAPESTEWTHVAVTFNFDADEVKVYANGALVEDQTKTGLLGTGNLNGVGPTLIGQAYGNASGALYNNGTNYDADFLLHNFVMEQGVFSGTVVETLYTEALPKEPFVPSGLSVHPGTAKINKGAQMRFVADITGEGGNPTAEEKAVTWVVSGNTSASTKIAADGNLVVGADESASILTVKAASNKFDSLTSEASVTVGTPRTDGGISFGVLSDLHVGATEDLTAGNNGRASTAFSFFNDPEQKADVVIANGDLTNGGRMEFGIFRNIREANLDIPLIATMGNHDENQWDLFEQYTGNKANDVQVINGYYFITVSPGSGELDETTGRATGGGNDTYTYVKSWLLEQIAAAEAADPTKPVFVFVHHPISDTHYLTDEQGSDDLLGVLDGHNQVVVFSGHTHGINNLPQVIWQDGGYTTVSNGSVCAGELVKSVNAASSNMPKGVSDSSQAISVDADDEGNVTIKTRDFLNNRWLEEYTFNINEELPFTAERAQQTEAPSFGSEASARVGEVNMTEVTFEIDQAEVPSNSVDNFVEYYNYQIIDSTTGTVVKDFNDWSGWFFPEPPATLKQTVLGLIKSTSYELRVYAVDAYGQKSEDFLSAEFTTTALDNTLKRPIDYVLTFENTLESFGTAAPDEVEMYRLLIKPDLYDREAHYGENVHGRDSSSIYMVPLNFVDLDGGLTTEPFSSSAPLTRDAEDPIGNKLYIDYSQSFSAAFWFNVEYLREDGQPCLLSNRNPDNQTMTGFTFRTEFHEGQNWLSLEYTPVSGQFNEMWLTPITNNEWIHTAATFDYENNKVIAYVNGEVVAEADADLSGGIGGITAEGRDRSTFFGSSAWNYTEEHGGYNGGGSDNGVRDENDQPEGRHTVKFWADDLVMSSCVYTQEELQSIMEDPTTRPEHFTVNFDTGGGAPYPVQQTVYDGRSVATPVEPVLEGQKFQGWATSPDGEVVYKAGENYPVSTNTTLHAVYVPLSGGNFTVTFVDWDGSVLKTEEVASGSSATPPTNPTRAGYTFIGWDGNYSNVGSSTTITALYEQNGSRGQGGSGGAGGSAGGTFGGGSSSGKGSGSLAAAGDNSMNFVIPVVAVLVVAAVAAVVALLVGKYRKKQMASKRWF